MKQMAYRITVNAPDSMSEDALARAIEDGLESLGGGLVVQYQRAGYAEGLPDPGERTASFPTDYRPMDLV